MPLAQFRVPPQHLLVDGDCTDAWRRLQKGNDFSIEDVLERIRPSPAASLLLLRWQVRILFDAIGRRSADRRLGRGNLGRVFLS
jgi:hypothetical protein